ncbi:unnamed protein product, partial [Scytosiphon promiscuus]
MARSDEAKPAKATLGLSGGKLCFVRAAAASAAPEPVPSAPAPFGGRAANGPTTAASSSVAG